VQEELIVKYAADLKEKCGKSRYGFVKVTILVVDRQFIMLMQQR
jgi:hypothetical protein